MSLTLHDPITAIRGIGQATKEKLERLGIATIRDLLYHIPTRYEDFRAQKTIAETIPEEKVTIRATVHSITKFSPRRNLTIIRGVITDDTGKLDVVWFNQPYLLMALKKGEERYFTGKISLYNKKKTLNSPSIEDIDSDAPLHSGRLVPIYPETAGLTSRMLRTAIDAVLKQITIEETLSPKLLSTHHLPPLQETLQTLHFPQTPEQAEPYHRRLAFEEVYTLLRDAKHRKSAIQKTKVPHPLKISTEERKRFERALPFHLSPSQVSTLLDISLDLVQTYPSRRLIQGEVGSGKTVVAAFALYCAAHHNSRSILVAPTQILATQHYASLKMIFDELKVPLFLVTGEKEHRLPQQLPENAVFVGTHVLFAAAKEVSPNVVVIDEEHRFGVEQRETFWKFKKKPHMLTMTATPIPRTVAHTVLADQDVSYLEEIPEKKKRITTKVVSEKKRADAYRWIDTHIEKGAQVFVVCPFIEQSEIETLADVKSAEVTFHTIMRTFPKRRVGLLHGKIKQAERAKILEHMRAGKLDILVATPMIEVGIDIPQAGIILIEAAERFGLAQLHQLRGRVGRAGQQAYCLLFPSEGVSTTRRLSILEKESNGNILAEQDLKLRGTGELFGTRQHGWDTLRFASWFDEKLIQECKKAVGEM